MVSKSKLYGSLTKRRIFGYKQKRKPKEGVRSYAAFVERGYKKHKPRLSGREYLVVDSLPPNVSYLVEQNETTSELRQTTSQSFGIVARKSGCGLVVGIMFLLTLLVCLSGVFLSQHSMTFHLCIQPPMLLLFSDLICHILDVTRTIWRMFY